MLCSTAVWTGTNMIVWGGHSDLNDVPQAIGARYDPQSNQWTAVTTVGAPQARSEHTAVWTGAEMIVWGGWGSSWPSVVYPLASGGRYDPDTDTWAPTTLSGAPEARLRHVAVWTGVEMVVWGGRWADDDFGYIQGLADGGRYDPATDTWIGMADVGAPWQRSRHTAVWTGAEMIVWGGSGSPLTPSAWELLSSGGRYDPVSNVWAPTPDPGSIHARRFHTAVWTGAEMIMWGGEGNDGALNTGLRYAP